MFSLVFKFFHLTTSHVLKALKIGGVNSWKEHCSIIVLINCQNYKLRTQDMQNQALFQKKKKNAKS